MIKSRQDYLLEKTSLQSASRIRDTFSPVSLLSAESLHDPVKLAIKMWKWIMKAQYRSIKPLIFASSGRLKFGIDGFYLAQKTSFIFFDEYIDWGSLRSRCLTHLFLSFKPIQNYIVKTFFFFFCRKSRSFSHNKMNPWVANKKKRESWSGEKACTYDKKNTPSVFTAYQYFTMRSDMV